MTVIAGVLIWLVARDDVPPRRESVSLIEPGPEPSARIVAIVQDPTPIPLAPQGPFSIAGVVVDDAGEPVAHAQVFARAQVNGANLRRVEADATGGFVITDLDAGPARVFARHDEHERAAAVVVFDEQDALRLVLTRKPTTREPGPSDGYLCRFSGTLWRSGRSVPNRTLVVRQRQRSGYALGDPTVYTDSQGRFGLMIKPGEYDILARSTGFELAHVTVTESTSVDLFLPDAAVSGRVVEDGSGRPLAGVTVMLSMDDAGGHWTVKSDAMGMFAFDEVPHGSATLRVPGRWCVDGNSRLDRAGLRVDVPRDRPLVLTDLVLGAGTRIVVHVMRLPEEAEPFGEVALVDEEGAVVRWATPVFSAAGMAELEFDDLPMGSYSVRAGDTNELFGMLECRLTSPFGMDWASLVAGGLAKRMRAQMDSFQKSNNARDR